MAVQRGYATSIISALPAAGGREAIFCLYVVHKIKEVFWTFKSSFGH